MSLKKSNAAALAAYAASLTGGGREMIDILVSIARNTGESGVVRKAAAQEVLDRTVGKSALVIDAEVTVRGAELDVSKLSPARMAELKAALHELAAASGVPAPRLPAPKAAPVVIDVGDVAPSRTEDLEWDEPEENDDEE